MKRLTALVDMMLAPRATEKTSKWCYRNPFLRLLSSIFALTILCVSLALIPNPAFKSSPILPITLAVASISWDIVIVRMARLHKPWINEIRPVHITTEAFLWLMCLGSLAMQTIPLLGSEKADATSRLSKLVWVSIGTLVILFIIRFTLFIRSTAESSRAKKEMQIRQLIHALSRENDQSTNDSTLSLVSPHHKLPPPPDYHQGHIDTSLKHDACPLDKLPSLHVFTVPVVTELAATPEPTELPGDYSHTSATNSTPRLIHGPS